MVSQVHKITMIKANIPPSALILWVLNKNNVLEYLVRMNKYNLPPHLCQVYCLQLADRTLKEQGDCVWSLSTGNLQWTYLCEEIIIFLSHAVSFSFFKVSPFLCYTREKRGQPVGSNCWISWLGKNQEKRNKCQSIASQWQMAPNKDSQSKQVGQQKLELY